MEQCSPKEADSHSGGQEGFPAFCGTTVCVALSIFNYPTGII